MHDQDVMALVDKTAALMEQFERRCIDIDQRLAAASQQLQSLMQQVPDVVARSADHSLRTLPEQVIGNVRHGLERPVDAYEQRLQQAGRQVGDGAQALAAQLRRMERLHKSLVWKTFGAVLGSLLLMLAGGIWLSQHYYGVIREHQIAGDLLKAYDGADVILCGDRLCANTDPDGARYGEQGQYRPVRPR